MIVLLWIGYIGVALLCLVPFATVIARANAVGHVTGEDLLIGTLAGFIGALVWPLALLLGYVYLRVRAALMDDSEKSTTWRSW